MVIVLQLEGGVLREARKLSQTCPVDPMSAVNRNESLGFLCSLVKVPHHSNELGDQVLLWDFVTTAADLAVENSHGLELPRIIVPRRVGQVNYGPHDVSQLPLGLDQVLNRELHVLLQIIFLPIPPREE